jgi:transketolase
MLLYALLYLTGYDVSLEDVKDFRQLGSITPGHPEAHLTPGVEVTTGPLGQGFANGVGLAMAEAHLAARFNRPGHEIVDHYTYGIVSDGDLMEGVAAEAASLAGHLRLGKLIYLYDQNQISLAGTTSLSFSEDVAARFAAYGWQTIAIDGMETDQVREALDEARADATRPTLILARTIIGYGAPKKQNTFGVHGSPLGPDELKAAKEALGIPLEPAFFVPDEAAAKFREALDRGAEAQAAWRMRFEAYAEAYPDLAAEFTRCLAGELPEGWDADLPRYEVGGKAVATRVASGETINAFAAKVTNFVGGSADLNPSTNTVIKGGGDFQAPGTDPTGAQGTSGGGWGYAGRNVHFGVREHAMGSIVNGMAAHGGLLPFGSTFLVFSDYMRPSVRLSALSPYRSIWVFTHDSIGVGEDGPTHEPVEHVMALRAIPRLVVLRPGDPNETVEAWKVALTEPGPVALALSRQGVNVLDRSGAKGDVSNGGYVLIDGDGEPDVVLIGTGTELELAVKARELLAEHVVAARVVSLPSWELFERQGAAYKASVLGPAGTPRVSVEAGTTLGWCRYVGERGASVGIDTYGASGPGAEVLAHYGFTTERVAATALRLIGKDDVADQIEPKRDGGDTAGEEATGGEGHS